jgi:hypothetical protein
MSKKIGLIQIDGKMPNLALMKLATWHKKKGDEVFFVDLSSFKIDQWYGSKIFMGGSGYNMQEQLPNDIETQVPDYKLFKTDYSIGFTSRGCVRNCDFCIVKEKEKHFQECEYLKDIKHSKYIVMDNNFLASKIYEEKLKYFIKNNIQVCFTQGLDIRLIHEKSAKLLSNVQYYDRNFKNRRLYFAFDSLKIEKIFREKINILLKYIKSYHIMIYVLTGFNSSFEDDIKRFNIIREYGCDPYIMLFNKFKSKSKLRQFARWVNARIYSVCDFEDYLSYSNAEKKKLKTVSKSEEKQLHLF